MNIEISVAVHFVTSYLYNKLPRRRVDAFGDELKVAILKRLQSSVGDDSSLHRISMSGPSTDKLVLDTARACGLDTKEMFVYLPEALIISIARSEVTYQIGETGQTRLLYTAIENEDKQNLKTASNTMGAIDAATSPQLAQQPDTNKSDFTAPPTLYTVGMFAQTKFGSTKSKMAVPTRRSNRQHDSRPNYRCVQRSIADYSNYRPCTTTILSCGSNHNQTVGKRESFYQACPRY
jgi:hypothetical protein